MSLLLFVAEAQVCSSPGNHRDNLSPVFDSGSLYLLGLAFEARIDCLKDQRVCLIAVTGPKGQPWETPSTAVRLRRNA